MFTETPDLIQGLVQEGTGMQSSVPPRTRGLYALRAFAS